MNLDLDHIQAAIKAEICRIADRFGTDASALQDDEVIPFTGYIDSAGLLELVAWYEAEYQIKVPAEDFTVDHLGTLRSMAEYVRRRKAAA